MESEPLSFGTRLGLAWRVLTSGRLATRVKNLEVAPAIEGPTEPVVEEETPPDHTAALQLLTILQREGRFVDFVKEDMTGFSDQDIGAAARVVHQGCRRGLAQYVELAPVRTESEGAAIELAPGYDAARTRVTGNVVGEPPFKGTLAHHGWHATKIDLPTLSEGHDATVVAPAEVEL